MSDYTLPVLHPSHKDNISPSYLKVGSTKHAESTGIHPHKDENDARAQMSAPMTIHDFCRPQGINDHVVRYAAEQAGLKPIGRFYEEADLRAAFEGLADWKLYASRNEVLKWTGKPKEAAASEALAKFLSEPDLVIAGQHFYSKESAKAYRHARVVLTDKERRQRQTEANRRYRENIKAARAETTKLKRRANCQKAHLAVLQIHLDLCPEGYVTIDAAVEEYGIHIDSIKHFRKDGRIRAVKVSKFAYLLREDLEAWKRGDLHIKRPARKVS